MRPDKSDMIMLAANFIWHGLPVDVVVAAGDRPKRKALEWLMKFSSENKRLLIYQNLTVKEVAYQLGFNDPFYFSNFFKKHTHQSPKSYQAKYAL